MYKCNCCNAVFDEPKIINSTWEAYYGISSMFERTTPKTIYVCPECDDDDYEEYYEDDLENDWEEE